LNGKDLDIVHLERRYNRDVTRSTVEGSRKEGDTIEMSPVQQ